MAPPKHVNIGPLTKLVFDGSKFFEHDEFPAHQEWADEIEKILTFVEQQNQIEKYINRLQSKERDATIAEIRYAYFLNNAGFEILDWEPESSTGCPGDLEIQYDNLEPIFVEIKQPGWGSELSEAEKYNRRAIEVKYKNGEARILSTAENVIYSITKALKKLDVKRINLIGINDDLFISPLNCEKDDILGRISYELKQPECSAVTSVMLLHPYALNKKIEYKFGIIDGQGRKLPVKVQNKFKSLENW